MTIAKNRNNFFDFVKAAAIIIVVFGHCIQYGSGKDFLNNCDFFDNPVFIFIYSFHMPLFMLISGYLFAFSANRRSIRDNMKKKIVSLIVPIIAWVALYQIGAIASDIYHSNSIHLFGIIKAYILGVIQQFWFLWAIFWSSLAVLVVRKYLRDSMIAYMCIALICLFIPNKLNIQMYSFMFPYFVLGYKYNFYQTKLVFKEATKARLFICVSILFFVLLLLYNRDSYIYTTGYYILNGNTFNQLYIDFYRFCIGLIGSCFFLLLLKKVYSFAKDSNWLQSLLYIGQKTMGIYIIQGYFISYILVRLSKNLQSINYGITVIESIVIIILCLSLIYVLQKNKITNRLFLGGK